MRIIETVREMREARAGMAGPVALMATLGGMHYAHEVLLDTARSLGKTLVASLFLNPRQFGPGEDLASYPADTERDLEIFRTHGVEYVFKPSVNEMYTPDFQVDVDPGPLANVLEGAHRPGHFDGVAQVVARFSSYIRPDVAVWGAKDAQQNLIIRHVTEQLGLPTRHVIIPTVRAPDGLALSSRNAYLTDEQRAAAPVLYRGLQAARIAWSAGEKDAEALRAIVRDTVSAQPIVELHYVSVADPESLAELNQAFAGALVSLAARVGRARLIDNVVLE